MFTAGHLLTGQSVTPELVYVKQSSSISAVPVSCPLQRLQYWIYTMDWVTFGLALIVHAIPTAREFKAHVSPRHPGKPHEFELFSLAPVLGCPFPV